MTIDPNILTALAMRLESRRRKMLQEPGNVSEQACDDKLQHIRNGYLVAASELEAAK